MVIISDDGDYGNDGKIPSLVPEQAQNTSHFLPSIHLSKSLFLLNK